MLRSTRLLVLMMLLVPGTLAAQQTPSGKTPGTEEVDGPATLSPAASMLMLDSVAARARRAGTQLVVDVSGLSADITDQDLAARGLERKGPAEEPCPPGGGAWFRDVRRSAGGSYAFVLHEVVDADGWVDESLWWIACDADGCRVTRIVKTVADIMIICPGEDG